MRYEILELESSIRCQPEATARMLDDLLSGHRRPAPPPARTRPHRVQTRLLLALVLWTACWGGLALLSAPSVQAAESVKQRLEEAIQIYQAGGTLEASARLTGLLYPLKLIDRQDIARARLYLGLCYYVLDRRADAALEFRGLFRVAPDFEADPLTIPPEVIRFIELQRPTATRTQAVPGLGERLPAEALTHARVAPENFLPFGIPHLRRGDLGLGVALASTELGLLAANVASYWFLRANNVHENTPTELYPTLQAVRVVNVGAFSTLLVVAALGIGDSVYRYRMPEVPGTSSHLRLTPLVQTMPTLPRVVGVGLELEGRF